MPWPCVLAGEVKASRPGGCLAIGDEEPTPDPRTTATVCHGLFHEHLDRGDEGEVFKSNAKRAAIQAWAHPSPAGHYRPN
jgi:hypothetical protein